MAHAYKSADFVIIPTVMMLHSRAIPEQFIWRPYAKRCKVTYHVNLIIEHKYFTMLTMW